MYNDDRVPTTYLTSKQVAQRLNKSLSTISRMVAAGKLTPALRLEGLRGAMWFAPAEVTRYERTQRQERQAS